MSHAKRNLLNQSAHTDNKAEVLNVRGKLSVQRDPQAFALFGGGMADLGTNIARYFTDNVSEAYECVYKLISDFEADPGDRWTPETVDMVTRDVMKYLDPRCHELTF